MNFTIIGIRAFVTFRYTPDTSDSWFPAVPILYMVQLGCELKSRHRHPSMSNPPLYKTVLARAELMEAAVIARLHPTVWQGAGVQASESIKQTSSIASCC